MTGDDDEVMILDARAAIASSLTRAVVGYSDKRVRALAWLSVATPRLYAHISAILRDVALNQSPGASRSLIKAIQALSLEEYHNKRAEKQKAE